VRFTASNGQNCIDSTPTATSATTASFSCTITFAVAGSASVVGEYLGSIVHAYSGSDPVTHTANEVPLFRNGFEVP
jgi:hypothetical protein